MIRQWLTGLIRTRSGRLLGTIGGIALAVALLLDLGLFLDHSSANMTARALRAISTDWQVELVPGADIGAVEASVRAAAPAHSVDVVSYASVDAFEAATGSTVQTTGAGEAVGIPDGYFDRRAGDLRLLSGNLAGVLLLQQTAANLHVQSGDSITVRRPDGTAVSLLVGGIIDLRSADSFFQAIGVPAGAAPQAPPDNAVFVPLGQWTKAFATQASSRPDTVRAELHVALDHSGLPPDPNQAYAFAASQGRNLEARLAGSALLSNNLAAQLDATRGDALYAKVLFLFLGTPGAVLAALLTLVVALSGAEVRRRDLALLKLRGAAPALSTRYAAAETALVGIAGAVLGLGAGTEAAEILAGIAVEPRSLPWVIVAGLAGVGLAATTIVAPAFWMARTASFASTRVTRFRPGSPLWERLWVDLIALALAGIVFWQTAATGYQVVLATEGVTATAVDYTAFLAPVLLLIGATLLTLRLTRLALYRGRAAIAFLVRPLAQDLAPAIGSALSRQRRRLGLGVSLTALAMAFLVSTAVFNATYETQARVDAELTNGADITVTGTTDAPAGAVLKELRRVPGVASAQPMQHRYAYVGSDLQDLYGVDPATIETATTISNTFFQNDDARGTLSQLANRPDAVLVSEETVTDFQLTLGDTLNLRLQGADHAYHVVPFIFTGVVREFPTAPRDSFLVANASYVTKATQLPAAEIVLVRADGDIEPIKQAVDTITREKGLRTTSLGESIQLIASSLTAVDLKGLSRIELAFAVVLAIGATGLVLALSFADRRRDFAILRALGASFRVVGVFVWSEVAVVVIGGTLFGCLSGALVAQVLVKVLEGVFDPPPETMSIPWGYLLLAEMIILSAIGGAALNAIKQAARDPLAYLKGK